MKYVQSKQKKHQNDVNDVVMVFLLLTLNIFDTFLSDSIIDFEQVNVALRDIILGIVNLFDAIGFFLYFLKISKNKRFSDFFRGYRKGPVP